MGQIYQDDYYEKNGHKINIFYLLCTCKVKTETIPGFPLKSRVKYTVKMSELFFVGGLLGGQGARGDLQIFI